MSKIRALKIFLAMMLMTTMLTSVFSYADTPSSWAEAEVNEARGKGLILPEADGDYQEYISRELFCKLIVNLVELVSGSPVTITIVNPFNDTNNTDIIKAYQLGIVNGTSATTFAPNDLINREQVAAMMMRAARKLDDLMNHNYTMIQLMGEATFADTNEISGWALNDVRVANAIGIMNGIGGNRIGPQGNTTIEQSILLILRVFNEYLPLMENMAPAPLPTGVYEYDVPEGDSLSFNLADIAYDPDGDPMTIVGTGGNLTYGYLSSLGTVCTFTAEMVDANQVSLWHVTVSDGTEQTQIDFTFNVLDDANIAPTSISAGPFHVNEGESIVIHATDIAEDLDGDTIRVSQFADLSPFSTSYGTPMIMLSIVGDPSSFSYNTDLYDGDGASDTFNLTVSDGVATTVIAVTIYIDNVNNPPVGLPADLTNIFHQDESTNKIYWGFDVATDPDGDTLLVTDFEISDQNQHDLGTASIRDFDGAYYFYFEADAVSAAAWTWYDLTVTDGIHEVIVPIRIQVDNN